VLALEWDQRQLVLVEARVAADHVELTRCLSWTWPDDVDAAAAPERAGEWLKQQLDSAGVRTTRLLATLPRHVVTLKHLELPPATDEELPALVRFQSSARSARGVEELCIDFVPYAAPPGTNRAVVAATVPLATVALYGRLASAAGLDLQSLGLRALAAGELIRRRPAAAPAAPADQTSPASSSDLELAITRGAGQFELSLFRQGQIFYSHAAPSTSTDTKTQFHELAAAIHRLLASLKTAADRPVRQAWLLGTAGRLEVQRAALAGELGGDVDILDPFDLVRVPPDLELPESRSKFAGPIGALLSWSGGARPTIDFLAPRRAIVRRDLRRWRIVAAGVAALAAAGAFAWYRDAEIRALDARVEGLRQIEAKMQELVKKGQPLAESAKRVHDWTTGDAAWLDEFLAFTGHMPDADRAYLASLRFEFDEAGRRATLKAAGYAREHDDVLQLSRRLLDAREHYELQPHGIVTGQKDREYPSRFEIEATLAARAPAAAEPNLPGARPAPPAARDSAAGPKTAEKATADASKSAASAALPPRAAPAEKTPAAIAPQPKAKQP
jgi:Tfp pilus assembly PilM family ATPase